jgi:two-component system, cell cycle sensor histidine kinase and response regulator CckA
MAGKPIKISIRWVFTGVILGLIWGTHLITTTSAFLTSQRVLERHAKGIMTNIAELAMEQSRNHLAHAHSAADLTKRLLMAQVVSNDLARVGELERYFFDQLALYPHLAGIYFGTPDGDFYDVRRAGAEAEGSFRSKFIEHDALGQRSCRLVWRDTNFRMVTQKLDFEDAYDPRQRPWYRLALEKRSIVWTDPYVFFTSQKPGITIAGPVFAPTGKIRGVVGVDIEIDHLSRFLASLSIGTHGVAFMLNRNGDVVAFPDLEKLSFQKTDDQGNRLVKIDELDAPVSRKAFAAAGLKGEAGVFKLDTARFCRFDEGGQTYMAMFIPFEGMEWPWIIGVHLPEDDYLGEIKANRRINMVITTIISILATLAALILARGVIRPLSALEKESLALRDHRFKSRLHLRSPYKEIQATADAFQLMSTTVQASQAKFRGIFNNIQDGYYEATVDGTLLEISPSIERISKYTRKELIGRDIKYLYPETDERAEVIRKLTRTGRLNDHEITLRDKDGSLQHCSLNCILVEEKSGGSNKIIGSLRVITDRKRAEQELDAYRNQLEDQVRLRTADLKRTNEKLRAEIVQRQITEDALRSSEEKYRNILNSIEEGYFEVDLKGRITLVNSASCALMNCSRDELVGLDYPEYTTSESTQKLRQAFQQVFKTGKAVQVEPICLVARNGDHKMIGLSVSLMRAADQTPTGYRGVARDITYRIEAENQQKLLQEQLQQAQRLEAIGTLAGGIAHDFNNLLMGIQGNVSLLGLHLPDEAHITDGLKAIERCVDSGGSLTRQLLGFARGGKYVVTAVDLNDMLQKTAELFGRTKKEVKIHGSYARKLWPVKGDRGQLEQVLVNLYLNAWHAMEEGGDIYLSSENVVVGDKLAQAGNMPPGRYVHIEIRDTGHGMDEATRVRIFEPFFTTKKMGHGTGLGLASAFGIIKNHQGTITVESVVGVGTRFHIYLPAELAEKPVQSPPSSRVARGEGTILVVDDEPYILASLQDMLRELGYTVLVANGGMAALETFDTYRDPIDLVILDMIMPDMGGAETFDLIKAKRPEVKVLLSSGYSMNQLAEEIISRGCNGFLQKPFNLTRLSQMVYSVLNETS